MKETHDRVLMKDLKTLAGQLRSRRDFLRLLGGAALLPLVGCGGNSQKTSSNGQCTTLPPETAGPFPGDGTNGPNALALQGVVRQDITKSIAGASGKAAGVPMKIELTIVNVSDNCAPLSGYAVYLWHCDRAGGYSMYSDSVKDENYLRGVQTSDEQGKLVFQSIFPGCYQGRWPHAHFEVYGKLEDATNGRQALSTSQLALPKESCESVYATAGYESSVSNLARLSLDSDNVFADGYAQQLATVSGSLKDGYTASLVIAVEPS